MMNNIGHIFLSYRSEESSFALKLAADLRNRGVRIWMDRLEMGIKGGDDWRRAIEQAINTCNAMIAALSPDYIKSAYCRNEVARADRLGRPVFPVLLQPVPDDAWPIELERIQYVDFRNWQDEANYGQKFAELLSVLQGQAAAQTGEVPDAETQYLTSLVAEFESRRGVLEYVDLMAQADPAERPAPMDGWENEFSLLIRSDDLPANSDPSDRARIPFPSVRAVLEEHARFVLIGEPGAGKTTTLRRLAVEAARKRLDNPRLAPLPLLLYLPQWTQGAPLDFIAAHYPFNRAGLTDSLTRGDLALYLDGLNEMGADGKLRAQALKHWLHSDQAPRRVIITCREADYSSEYDLDLPVVLTEGLDEPQIRQFASNYLGEKAQPFLGSLLPATTVEGENVRYLFTLASNPYLLSALIYVYLNAPGGNLPGNPGALFQGLVRALWEREQKKLTPGWVPFTEVEGQLADLSFAMIHENTGTEVSEGYALNYVNASLLKAARSASLVDFRGGRVRFIHQLLQEYFAAVALMKKGLHTILQPPQFGAGGRLNTPWDEVVIAACGFGSDNSRMIQTVLAVDPWLASKCIVRGARVSSAVFRATGNVLIAALDRPDWSIRAASARALALLNDTQAIPVLRQLGNDPTLYVRRSVRKALGVLDKTDEAVQPPQVVSFDRQKIGPGASLQGHSGKFYSLQTFIGRGSFAEVYRARQNNASQDVAVKVFFESAELVAADTKLDALLELSHPHLIQLLDCGRHHERFFVVSELAAAGTLADRLRSGALPLAQVVQNVEQLASALDFIHQRGLIHGDLRPGNIFFDTNENALIGDLGIARLFVGSEAITGEGLFVGTPAYLAPEQWSGTSQGAQTDIYVLGILAFEMLTGTLPFKSDSPATLMYQHLQQPPPRATSTRPKLPLPVDTVLARALAKKAEVRYAQAGDFASALAAAISGQ